MNKVVLGFPYDGALLWHLGPHNEKRGKGYSGTHPYYRELYGPNHFKIGPKAASLCVLYDEVIIAPADAGLPDYQTYLTGDGYFNPHLGLKSDWKEYYAAQDWVKEQTRKDLENPKVLNCLPSDPKQRFFVLERTNLQILLALKHDAKIIAGNIFFKILESKFPNPKNANAFKATSVEPEAKQSLLNKYFDVACLEFRDLDYDRMMALRADSKLKSYSNSFHKKLDAAVITNDPTEHFFSEMRTSMERSEVLEEVNRGFSTGGSIVSLSALILKEAGALRSFINVAKGTVEKFIQRDSWVLLGSRISEVSMREWSKKNIPKR